MTLGRVGRAAARRGPGAAARQHLIAVVQGNAAGMRAAEHAGRLATESHSSLTVALILDDRMGLALAALASAVYFTYDDVEIDVLIHLSRVLDPMAVPWRLERVALPHARTIASLARLEHARAVVVGRRRLFRARYAPWIATVLRRRYGLPVLLVTPGDGDVEKERVR
jgi:hypothetical protein